MPWSKSHRYFFLKAEEAIQINKRFIEAAENLVKEGKVMSLRAAARAWYEHLSLQQPKERS
ncbi:hypothetical protein [Dyadobacter sandarakinus]|uniref:Uncharacterized protein n=1 Tax=Dyadobacter sandarakinus TaxID=2747268 RepID=A0ABX7I6A1_9BACT|nr:hypothetical protein [Dyadobacter sandarakinus]QRR01631.1 hypothetical protein HWI92_12310 [Dyadobacter sandarakinus]